jgi:hypothetical protein
MIRSTVGNLKTYINKKLNRKKNPNLDTEDENATLATFHIYIYISISLTISICLTYLPLTRYLHLITFLIVKDCKN